MMQIQKVTLVNKSGELIQVGLVAKCFLDALTKVKKIRRARWIKLKHLQEENILLIGEVANLYHQRFPSVKFRELWEHGMAALSAVFIETNCLDIFNNLYRPFVHQQLSHLVLIQLINKNKNYN